LKIPEDIWNKLKRNRDNLALLEEAIDAFDQIRSLVVEKSEQQPCLTKKSLVQLHQLILRIIEKGHLEELEGDRLWRFLGTIEEDLSRVANSAESILDTVHKIQNLLSDDEQKEKD
jgi:hypothetical protein